MDLANPSSGGVRGTPQGNGGGRRRQGRPRRVHRARTGHLPDRSEFAKPPVAGETHPVQGRAPRQDGQRTPPADAGSPRVLACGLGRPPARRRREGEDHRPQLRWTRGKGRRSSRVHPLQPGRPGTRRGRQPSSSTRRSSARSSSSTAPGTSWCYRAAPCSSSRSEEAEAASGRASWFPEPGFPGKVTRIEQYGAFVDVGGVEGLLHVSQMDYQRVSDPERLRRTRPGDRGRGAEDRGGRRADLARDQAAEARSRGMIFSRSTRSARSSPARSRASRTTVPSWSWPPVSRGSATSVSSRPRGSTASARSSRKARRSTCGSRPSIATSAESVSAV